MLGARSALQHGDFERPISNRAERRPAPCLRRFRPSATRATRGTAADGSSPTSRYVRRNPRSSSTLFSAPRSAKYSCTRSGTTCLSWMPATISVGVCMRSTAALPKPHDRRVRRAPHALAPRRADGIGLEHRAPHGRGRRGLVLIRAADLPLPVRREVGVRLRVERGACAGLGCGGCWPASRRVRRREQHELRDLVGIARRVAARARTTERPADEAHARHVAQRADVLDDGVEVVPVRRDRRELRAVRRLARRARRAPSAARPRDCRPRS